MSAIANAASDWRSPSFSTKLVAFVLQHFGTLRSNSQHVAGSTGWNLAFGASTISRYFGGLNSNHALGLTTTFGFHLHEPQVSAGIAHFCDAAPFTDLKRARCRAVVKALLPNEPNDGRYLKSLDEARSFKVAAERRIDNGSMRMDLLVTWHSGNDHFRLVVEMKFDHKLTSGQLEKYGQDALAKVDDPSHLRLVFLSLDGEFKQADPRCLKETWWPISWLNFLRGWESLLSADADDDPTFKMFRRHVWAKAGI